MAAGSLSEHVIKALQERFDATHLVLRYSRDVSEVSAKDIPVSDLEYAFGKLYIKSVHYISRGDACPDYPMDTVSDIQVKCIDSMNQDGWPLRVQSLSGKKIIVHVESSNTVRELSEKIHLESGIPVDQQRLLYAGRQLIDSRTLSDYNINRDSTVSMVLRLRGGMHHITSGRIDYCSTVLPDVRLGTDKSVFACVFTVNGREKTYYMHPMCKMDTLRARLDLETQMETDLEYFEKNPEDLSEEILSNLSREAILRYYNTRNNDSRE